MNIVVDDFSEKKLKLKCTFCAMPALFFCDKKDCALPVCKKHTTQTPHGEYCPYHKPLTIKVHSA